jgi:hypothetical protein
VRFNYDENCFENIKCKLNDENYALVNRWTVGDLKNHAPLGLPKLRLAEAAKVAPRWGLCPIRICWCLKNHGTLRILAAIIFCGHSS